MTALQIPELADAGWQVRLSSDPVARALAARHYTGDGRVRRTVGPPGRRLCLVTGCERAVWLSHYPRPEYALDGLDVYRCSLFRNEGAGLSSDLIVQAVELTEQLWGPPPDGWATWIDTRHVAGTNPGYCFKRAGWVVDRGYRGWQRSLVRLRRPA